MLLPVVSVLLAGALFGGLVRPRYPLEAALLCFALVMLTGFRLPVFVDVDGISRFEWERAALSAGAALALWSAAKFRTRHAPARDAARAPGANYLIGTASFVVFFLLVTSVGYSSVVYRVAMLELPQFPELRSADSPANTWLTLPFTADERRVSAFALALAVGLIGGVLALAAQRTPAHVASIALRTVSHLVKGLALAGLLAFVLAANWPALLNPFHVTRHVYDWAVVVGSLSVMLALRDRAASTFWIAAALSSVVAVRTAGHASQMMWNYRATWPEFIQGVLVCATPLGLAVGLAAGRLGRGKRFGLAWIGAGCLTIACALLSLDGFTWFEPYLQHERGHHTTRCLEEAPGNAYHIRKGSTALAPGDARRAFSRSPTTTREPPIKVVLHAALADPATDYLPVLSVAADYELPVYVYAPYLETVDLFTVAPLYVSNSSCAVASAPLRRLRNEPLPASVESVRQLLAWLDQAA